MVFVIITSSLNFYVVLHLNMYLGVLIYLLIDAIVFEMKFVSINFNVHLE